MMWRLFGKYKEGSSRHVQVVDPNVWENNIEPTDGEGQRPHQEVQLCTSTRYELAQVKQYNAIISLY